MYLAIDFGGTRTRAAWFSERLNLLARDEIPTQARDGVETVIRRMVELGRSVIPAGEQPRAIGLCGPGAQASRGIIVNAPTLPDWDNVPLAARISQAFGGVPTFMQNDANLGALAEYHLGAARGADPALYMTVSTGIGGGAIIGGKLFTGWRGLAIEPGFIRFPKADGRIYGLEDLASGTAIGRWARERLAQNDEPSSLRGLDAVDGKAVGEAAEAGDRLALAVVEEAGYWLGLGFAALTHLFNPQVIVVGGSVANLGDLIFAPAKRVLQAHLLDPLFYHPNLIQVAALRDDVCLIGAALHARDMSQG